MTLSILNLAAQVVGNITPYQRGYAQGFVAEQLLEQVALELATEGAVFVLKAAQVSERFAAALEKLESISSEAAKAFESVVAKLRTLVVEGKDAETLAKDIDAMTADVVKANLKEAGILEAIILDHCFAAGTPLLTPSGEKFIEDFVVGDEILTRPEDSPDASVRTSSVEKVFHLSGPTLELRVGGRTVVTTEKHPFYVLGRGWTWAAELKPGDMLLGHDGQSRAVESAELTARHESLYNLRVAIDRTYFVGSRSWGFSLWVHNNYFARQFSDGTWQIVGREAGTETVVKSGLSKSRAKGLSEEANELLRLGDREAASAAASNKGLVFVRENSSMSDAARAWENGAYNPGRAKGEVPALRYDNPNARGRNIVRFDGIDPNDPKILVDRKLNPTTKTKQVDDITRQAEALRQNRGYSLRIEVQNEAEKRAALRLLKAADLPAGTPITVVVV